MIYVRCPCGVKLKAPDHAEGRRMKCPKCGTVVTVPAPDPVDPLAPPRTPPPPQVAARPQPIHRYDPTETPVPLQHAWPEADDWYQPTPTTSSALPPPKASKRPLLVGVIGVAVALFAVGVVVILFSGKIGPGKATATTPGEEPEPTRTDTPAGWKAFRSGGVSVWVPESISLVEGDDTEPMPPVVDKKSWTNWQLPNLVLKTKPVSNPSGMWFWVNTGRLNPTFLAEHGQTPAACEAALKQIEDAPPEAEWTDATLGGLPARQRVIKVPPPNPPQPTSVTITRAVIRGETLYWCAVICTEADAAGPRVTTFFDSFRIAEGGPTGGRAAILPPDPPILPPAELPALWKKYQGDGFSVGVKEAARVATDGVTDPSPDDLFFKSVRRWIFEYKVGGKAAYQSVTGYAFKPSLVREYRQDPTAALDGLVKTYFQGPTPAGEKVTQARLGGVEGKQIVYPNLVSRVVVWGDTLYVLSVEEPGVGTSDATAKTFFDSFRFERK